MTPSSPPPPSKRQLPQQDDAEVGKARTSSLKRSISRRSSSSSRLSLLSKKVEKILNAFQTQINTYAGRLWGVHHRRAVPRPTLSTKPRRVGRGQLGALPPGGVCCHHDLLLLQHQAILTSMIITSITTRVPAAQQVGRRTLTLCSLIPPVFKGSQTSYSRSSGSDLCFGFAIIVVVLRSSIMYIFFIII